MCIESLCAFAKMAINSSQTLGRWVILIKIVSWYDSPTRSNSLLVNNDCPNAKRGISRTFMLAHTPRFGDPVTNCTASLLHLLGYSLG